MLLPNPCRYVTFLWCGLAALLAASVVSAADPLRDNTSLKFVPADASFYYSRLRMREQYEAFVKSSAWTKLMDLPAIKSLRELAETTPFAELPDTGAEGVQDWFALPENRELLELLQELISDEAFIYGDVSWAETYELLQKITRAMNESGQDPAQAAEKMLPLLDNWKIPDLVVGFKIKDAKRAEAQLARLEKVLLEQLEAVPEVKARFVRDKIGETEFLTLKLDGSLIPWDQLQADAEPENKAQAEKFAEKLKKKTFVMHLGIRDGYFLFSIGDSDEHIRKLGQSPLLVERPELAPLRKHADKSFYTLSFVSERFLKSASDVDGTIQSYITMAEKLLPESGLDEEVQKELLSDARALGSDLKKWIPKPGNYLGYGFFTARGSEGYSHDWSEQLSLDGGQKLSILDHVGGKPLAFAAGRAKYAPEVYETRVKWFGRALYWAEKLGTPNFEPEQVAIYDKLRSDLLPLVVRLDAAIKNMWIPAFKDGQSAFVIDAKTTIAKLAEGLPPPSKPLPMLEFGLVSGVSDAALLKQASAEFFDLGQRGMNLLNKHFPDAVEKTELTPPQTREFPEGTIYFYSLPMEAGVDPQFAPNAGLSANTLALSLVPKFSLRLLKKTPLEIKEGPLALADKPLASASYIDLSGMVDVLGAWIDYGFETAGATGLEEAAGVDPETVKTSKEVTHGFLEFLKGLKNISSVPYFENGALVTHSEWNYGSK
jgi:hypothetical protein